MISNQPIQSIELISFNLCPFVQRSVITLIKKGINFKITYIDLANKPDWFLKISPLGKVPVVRYGDDILFESAVINEFIDEITPDSLMPSDPLKKAKDRSWIEYSSQVIMSQYLTTVADNKVDYQKHSENLESQLARIENRLEFGQFFGGTEFSLVDSSLAPLFTRFNILKSHLAPDLLKGFPKLQKLTDKYLKLNFVSASVVDEFEFIYIEYLKNNNSVLTA